MSFPNSVTTSSPLRSGRQSNIELLRILAAVGVIILHYNNKKIGGAFSFVEAGSLGGYLLYFLEALNLGAVDLFMMIMGRFQSTQKEARLDRVVILLMQVSIVRIVYYFLMLGINEDSFTATAFARRALPANYFIITYCTIYVLSPYINKLLEVIKDKKRFVLILLFLFSFIPAALSLIHDGTGISIHNLIAISDEGALNGYTFINYLLMYIIGAVSRDLKMKKKTACIGLICCLVPMFILECLQRLSLPHPSSLHSYCNPLIIGTAFFSLMLFSSFTIGVRPWINRLASGSLMVYLTHQFFFPLFNIKYYSTQGGVSILLNLLVTITVCYLAGWLLSVVYGFLMRPIHRKLSKVLKNAVYLN